MPLYDTLYSAIGASLFALFIVRSSCSPHNVCTEMASILELVVDRFPSLSDIRHSARLGRKAQITGSDTPKRLRSWCCDTVYRYNCPVPTSELSACFV